MSLLVNWPGSMDHFWSDWRRRRHHFFDRCQDSCGSDCWFHGTRMLLGRDLPRLYDRLRPWRHFTDVTETTPEAFKVMLDVNPFRPEELSVRLADNFIVVIEGRHQEKCEDKKISAGLISRHFERRYRLPQGADAANLVSAMSSEGILTVKAPRLSQLPAPNKERLIPIQMSDKKSQSVTTGTTAAANISTSSISAANTAATSTTAATTAASKENYLNSSSEVSKTNQNTTNDLQQDFNINLKDVSSSTQKLEEKTKTSTKAEHCLNFSSFNYQDCSNSNYKVDECSSIASPPPSVCSNLRGMQNNSVEIEELNDTASTCSTATTTKNNNDDYIQIVSALKTATYENMQKTGGAASTFASTSTGQQQQNHHCSNIWCQKSPRVRIVPIHIEDEKMQ